MTVLSLLWVCYGVLSALVSVLVDAVLLVSLFL